MKYKEIFKLKNMLESAGIPFEFSVDSYGGGREGYHICYPVFDISERVCSVIESPASYGHEFDLLEIMGLLTDKELENDEVVGWLSSADVFKRIQKHYEESKIEVKQD